MGLGRLVFLLGVFFAFAGPNAQAQLVQLLKTNVGRAFMATEAATAFVRRFEGGAELASRLPQYRSVRFQERLALDGDLEVFGAWLEAHDFRVAHLLQNRLEFLRQHYGSLDSPRIRFETRAGPAADDAGFAASGEIQAAAEAHLFRELNQQANLVLRTDLLAWELAEETTVLGFLLPQRTLAAALRNPSEPMAFMRNPVFLRPEHTLASIPGEVAHHRLVPLEFLRRWRTEELIHRGGGVVSASGEVVAAADEIYSGSLSLLKAVGMESRPINIGLGSSLPAHTAFNMESAFGRFEAVLREKLGWKLVIAEPRVHGALSLRGGNVDSYGFARKAPIYPGKDGRPDQIVVSYSSLMKGRPDWPEIAAFWDAHLYNVAQARRGFLGGSSDASALSFREMESGRVFWGHLNVENAFRPSLMLRVEAGRLLKWLSDYRMEVLPRGLANAKQARFYREFELREILDGMTEQLMDWRLAFSRTEDAVAAFPETQSLSAAKVEIAEKGADWVRVRVGDAGEGQLFLRIHEVPENGKGVQIRAKTHKTKDTSPLFVMDGDLVREVENLIRFGDGWSTEPLQKSVGRVFEGYINGEVAKVRNVFWGSRELEAEIRGEVGVFWEMMDGASRGNRFFPAGDYEARLIELVNEVQKFHRGQVHSLRDWGGEGYWDRFLPLAG